MSGLPGIALVTRKRSAARMGSALGAELTARRRFWIYASVASIWAARSELADRFGEMTTK